MDAISAKESRAQTLGKVALCKNDAVASAYFQKDLSSLFSFLTDFLIRVCSRAFAANWFLISVYQRKSAVSKPFDFL